MKSHLETVWASPGRRWSRESRLFLKTFLLTHLHISDEEEKDWMVMMGLIRRNPKKIPFLLGIAQNRGEGLLKLIWALFHIQCILLLA